MAARDLSVIGVVDIDDDAVIDHVRAFLESQQQYPTCSGDVQFNAQTLLSHLTGEELPVAKGDEEEDDEEEKEAQAEGDVSTMDVDPAPAASGDSSSNEDA